MPPKKKGNKGKIGRMTEEERILHMERKALAEEELKRKKEDMLTQFLKDKLAKEEKSSKFNLNKLQHQWRVIMREGKNMSLGSYLNGNKESTKIFKINYVINNYLVE